VGRPIGNGSSGSPLLAQDDRGWPIIRSEVMAVSPSSDSLAIARRLNFTVERQDQLDSLGVSVAMLRAPEGMNAVEALSALRRADPSGTYDYDHIYNPSGSADAPVPAAAFSALRPLAEERHIRVGMIDGGVDTGHSAFQSAPLVTKDFAGTGNAPTTIHGTAVASLLVGHDQDFSGYLPDANLYAADVYGGAVNGGSAEDIARALNWMAANRIAVTNVSLAGPANALLGAVVKAFLASGHVLVAAAGNNGPASGPSFPAAYPGVVAVTSVDSQNRFELDASRAAAQFAALGVGVRAANPAGGYASMTGTSFAAPAVSARFALVLPAPNPAGSRSALAAIMQQAVPITDAANRSGDKGSGGISFLGAPR
jgi:subtilisin family serine protease